MTCTTVIPCLSSGLDKNNKIMSMFVLFSRLFLGHFESLAFLRKWGANLTPKQLNSVLLVNFAVVQQLSDNFSKMRGYID